MKHYDCIIIATGPAGQKAAIQAAKLGKSVAIIEKSKVVERILPLCQRYHEQAIELA